MGKPRFSEDERINMQLRREAGESLESIADDYDCSTWTVRYNTDLAFRDRHLARNEINREVSLIHPNNKIEAKRLRRAKLAERVKQCPAS